MTAFRGLFSRYLSGVASANASQPSQKTGNTFAIPDFAKPVTIALKLLSMIRKSFVIAFDYQLESSSVRLPLIADVEQHHSETWYLVKGLKMAGRPGGAVLPDMKIRRLNGKWVHRDSDKETNLSVIAGEAIDKYEKKMA
jgi:hypothetical protein